MHAIEYEVTHMSVPLSSGLEQWQVATAMKWCRYMANGLVFLPCMRVTGYDLLGSCTFNLHIF